MGQSEHLRRRARALRYGPGKDFELSDLLCDAAQRMEEGRAAAVRVRHVAGGVTMEGFDFTFLRTRDRSEGGGARQLSAGEVEARAAYLFPARPVCP